MSNLALIVLVNVFIFFITGFISSLLTAVSIPLAKRINFLDHPTRIKKHPKATPALGGVAVFLSFWIVVISGIVVMSASEISLPMFFAEGSRAYLKSQPSLLPQLSMIFLGGLIIFIVGILDDRFSLKVFPKLVGQIVAAIVLMSSGLTIHFVSTLGMGGHLLTLMWIVLMMNAFNFIDSMDGHCAGIVLISCFAFFAVTLIITQPYVGVLVMVCAGAVFGFLPFNWNPAKVFLGDNGSLFLGYLMAVFTLLTSYQFAQSPYITPLIPVFIFGVPLYDTLSVITVRLYRGQLPWKGDRNHFAHRLRRLGMTDKNAVLFSYFVALTMGLIAVLSTQVASFLGNILICVLFAAFYL